MDDEFDSLVCQYIIVVRHVEDEIMLARDFQQYLDEFGDREGHRRSVLYLLVDREPEFAVQLTDRVPYPVVSGAFSVEHPAASRPADANRYISCFFITVRIVR